MGLNLLKNKIKKILAYTLVFTFVLGFVFTSFFIPAKANQKPVFNNTLQNLTKKVDIHVTSSIQKVSLAVTTKINSSVTCLSSSGTEANLVQDGGVINLNQPASCFLLQDEVLPKNFADNLTVEKLAKSAVTVSVIGNKVSFSSENLHPAPLVPDLANTSSVTFLGFLSFVSIFKNKVKYNLIKEKLITLSFVSPERLQIFRC